MWRRVCHSAAVKAVERLLQRGEIGAGMLRRRFERHLVAKIEIKRAQYQRGGAALRRNIADASGG